MNRHSPPFRHLIRSAALMLLVVTTGAFAQSVQEHVHHASHGVMPFEMSKTIHVFTMTQSGGVQRVIVKDPAALDQVALIQEHLKHESARFQQGDYADPKRLHGAGMPGLAELEAAGSKLQVSYAPLPDGAQITFFTTDVALLTAVHRWFGAQLSEHGADARSE